MIVESFDLTGVDQTDIAAMELAWNNWERGIFARGLRPSEQPLEGSTETVLLYSLHPQGGLDAFNTRVELGLVVTHENIAGALGHTLVGAVA